MMWPDNQRLLIIAVLVTALAACGAPSKPQTPIPPGATPEDVAFLKAMDSRGLVNERGPQAEIDLAHRLCGELGQGMSVNGLARHYSLTSGSSMSDEDMHYFIETAAATYCPQHLR